MVTNSKMKQLLNDKSQYRDDKLIISLKSLDTIMNPMMKKINECIIIDYHDKIDESQINYNKLIDIYWDNTGIEAYFNEMRLNDILDVEVIHQELLASMSVILFNDWIIKLQKEYPNQKFCLILCINDSTAILRFHQLWQGEATWLSNDIESYEEAVVYQYI